MKPLRHGRSGAEKPGLLHGDGTIRVLTGLVPDIGGAPCPMRGWRCGAGLILRAGPAQEI
ncbi:MAG: hypothetical protein WAT25_13695 [Paracoccaceae bacterium]